VTSFMRHPSTNRFGPYAANSRNGPQPSVRVVLLAPDEDPASAPQPAERAVGTRSTPRERAESKFKPCEDTDASSLRCAVVTRVTV